MKVSAIVFHGKHSSVPCATPVSKKSVEEECMTLTSFFMQLGFIDFSHVAFASQHAQVRFGVWTDSSDAPLDPLRCF